MNLSEYSSSDQIFIDSNIFIDYSIPHPVFGKMAADFLERVEVEEVHAITTPAVMAEVSHILLLERGAVLLKNHNRNVVMNKIKSDSHFSNLCSDAIDELSYILLGYHFCTSFNSANVLR